MDYNVVSSVHFCIDVICLIIQYVMSQAFENNRVVSQRMKTDTFLPKYGIKGYRYDMFLRNLSHSLKADTKRPVNLILCENTCSAMAQKNPNRIKASR